MAPGNPFGAVSTGDGAGDGAGWGSDKAGFGCGNWLSDETNFRDSTNGRLDVAPVSEACICNCIGTSAVADACKVEGAGFLTDSETGVSAATQDGKADSDPGRGTGGRVADDAAFPPNDERRECFRAS
jgi:hypothetical protein